MKKKTAILGATGIVGQQFITLLENHPDFEITALCASEKSEGKKYAEAANWMLKQNMPSWTKNETVLPSTPKEVEKAGNVDLVFSCLPANHAKKTEEEFAKAGFATVSKASAHRMDFDVPLLIPEVNPEQLELIQTQKKNRNWTGFVSTDPNCSTIQLAIALKPLHDKYGLKDVTVTSMQALSGAGHSGIASLDITDNVIPFISGEEEKIENETLKILGKTKSGKVENASFTVSASCNRVNVSDGHLESVFCELEKKASVEEVENAFKEFSGEPQKLQLHSAPKKPIIVRKEENRPQPKFDKNAEKGMSITIGRVRNDSRGRIKFSLLAHNTIRGAAGAGILHAELLKAKKII
ncbi:MAG: aspartate-semialdehyde dehydrogenase [Candidatus Micrarchaeia archaeon]